MKKYIKFIKKYKYKILLVFLFLFLLLSLISSFNGKEKSKGEKSSFNLMSKFEINLSNFRGKVNKKIENEEIKKLKAENRELREKLILSESENQLKEDLTRLKNSLNFVEHENDSYITTKIIAKNNGNFYKTFTIDAGLKNNVKEDSIILNEDGLIGRCFEVSDNYAKVISIIDQSSAVSFEIMGKNNEKGILSKNVKIKGYDDKEEYIKGYLFNSNSKIKKGDTLVTSGLGLYSENIPIGKVYKVVQDEKNLLKYVLVKPFVDFKNLETVTVCNKVQIN